VIKRGAGDGLVLECCAYRVLSGCLGKQSIEAHDPDGDQMNQTPRIILILALSWFAAERANGQDAMLRSLEASYQYDDLGNVKQIVQSVNGVEFERHNITYQYFSDPWIVIPQQSINIGTADGSSVTRTVQFRNDDMRGVLTDQIIEPNGNESTYKATHFQIDTHGVVTAITSQDLSGQQNRSLSVQFDALEDLYPTAVTNGLNQTELFAIHPALGVLAAYQDANGVGQQRQYDGFGRLKNVLAADGANVSVTYNGTFLEMDAKVAGGRTLTIHYDAFGNVIESDATAFDGETVAVRTTYNGQNLVDERFGPCHVPLPPPAYSKLRKYTYDEWNRLIRLDHGNGVGRRWTYAGLKTVRYDAAGNQRYRVEDQLGRVTKSVALVAANREVPVTYHYGPFGVLDQVIDAYGNAVRLAYDVRGRPLVLDDPDAGNNTYGWTPFNELNRAQDGSSSVSTYARDALGRVLTITDKDGTSTFEWDTAPNGIGKLASATSSDGITTSYGYDPVGRVSTSSWSVDGNAYTFAFTYDPVGRLQTLTYPSAPGQTAFAIRQVYNQFSYPMQVVDAATGSLFWQADTENERGQITVERFGNGVATRRTYDDRGRLTGIITTDNLGSTPQSLLYSYYPTGSLQCRANQMAASTVAEGFRYDPLDRLFEWTATNQANGTTNPCTGGTQLLDQTFDYDDIGNLKQRATEFGTGPILIYQYGQNGAGPHAVTQVNSDAYGYDASGNQTSGPNRTVAYKAFNLPARVTAAGATVSFEYDAAHRRVAKHYPNGDAIIYVGGLYERRLVGGQASDVFYVPAAGRLVAQVQPSASADDRTLFLHGDALGSVQVVTNLSGVIREQLWYEPLGLTVDPANPQAVVTPSLGNVMQGFTSQFEDRDVGLDNMKGRIYDPRLGRFLSPDPFVQYPLRSQSLNRYSYALNNPLKWVDPSGFQNESSGSDESGSDQPVSGQSAPSGSQSGGSSIEVTTWLQSSDWAGTIGQTVSDNGASLGSSQQLAPTAGWWLPGSSTTTLNKLSLGFLSAKYVLVSISGDLGVYRTETPTLAGSSWTTKRGEYKLNVWEFGISPSSGPTLSLAEFELASVRSKSSDTVGDWLEGFTEETTRTGPAVTGRLGIKNYEVAAEIGASFASIKMATGINILGINASIFDELSAGVKLGAECGETVAIYCGPVGAGIKFGVAPANDSGGWGALFKHAWELLIFPATGCADIICAPKW
jgi:RHS repeat-associated protein